MPWNDVKPMEQKILFISDYLRQTDSFASLCDRYGVSRKTGYKWLGRYEQHGVEGLADQSRKPHRHPGQIPYAVRQRVIQIRTQSRLKLGAKKIRVKLAEQYPGEPVPAVSTINNILSQEGLSQKRGPKKRYDRYQKPLHSTSKPNELWSVDFKGQFKLGNGQWCYPLTVMDDNSRYLMGISAQKSTNGALTKQAFTRLFKEYGLPDRIRSDNGTPFSSRATAGLSTLAIWWIKLGICPERITPGRPQQNGKHERMHRTLKDETLRPASDNQAAQQRRFTNFITDYNQQRPHESLEMKTPASLYKASSRSYPTKLDPIEYPAHFEVKRTTSPGLVYLNNRTAYISHLLYGELLGLEQIDDRDWDVYFSFYRLGRITLPDERKGFCSIKV